VEQSYRGDDPDLDDKLLATIEDILKNDIPDPNRRRAVAMMIRVHVKVDMVHTLREKFDPFIGLGAVKSFSIEELLAAMRDAVVRLAGYGRDDPYQWLPPKGLKKKDKEKKPK